MLTKESAETLRIQLTVFLQLQHLENRAFALAKQLPGNYIRMVLANAYNYLISLIYKELAVRRRH